MFSSTPYPDDYIDSVPDAPWHIQPHPDHYSGDNNHNNVLELQHSFQTSHYEQQSFEEPPPVTKQLHVYNLKSTSTKKAIETVFSKYGIIRRIVVNKNDQGECDGTAMVYFA
jgi:RNA recognition motif-containing protein